MTHTTQIRLGVCILVVSHPYRGRGFRPTSGYSQADRQISWPRPNKSSGLGDRAQCGSREYE